MSMDYQSLFEKSKRNLQSSYEKFQPKTKYSSSTTSKQNHHNSEFLSTEEQTWRPQNTAGLIRSRVIANPSNYEINSNYAYEGQTTRPSRNGDNFANNAENIENRNDYSPNKNLDQQFLYSKTYIDQIKLRLENEKKELEKKNVYLSRMFDEMKLTYETKLRNSELEKHDALNKNRKEISDIESRYEKFTEALKFEILDLKKQREEDHKHMKELEDSCLKANMQLNNANTQNKNLEGFIADLKQQIRGLESDIKQKSSLSTNELQRLRSEFETEKNKIKIYFEGKIEKLRKETLKNEEICKIELTEKQKRICLLEGSLDELERTNTVFLENLNRDNQTLQETLKNKKGVINNYSAEIQKLNNIIDDLKREKYILQTQIAISNQPNKMNLTRIKE